jgi:hypothetical protein
LLPSNDETAVTNETPVDEIAEKEGRIKPAALWSVGVELDSLFDEDGNVNRGEVITAFPAPEIPPAPRVRRSQPPGGLPRLGAVRLFWALCVKDLCREVL